MTVVSAPWLSIPEGHYAINDPHDPGAITYWRRRGTKRAARPAFSPWPLKASYGPVLYASAVPRDLRGDGRREWIRSWHAANTAAYRAAVIQAVAADPIATGRRFAELTSRCCSCGRALTDARSKVYGIGPECRSGMAAAQLALYFAPEVGRAHAELLAGRPGAA